MKKLTLAISSVLVLATFAAGDITLAIAEVRAQDSEVCDETPKMIVRAAHKFSVKTGYKPLTLNQVKKKNAKRKIIPCVTKPPVVAPVQKNEVSSKPDFVGGVTPPTIPNTPTAVQALAPSPTPPSTSSSPPTPMSSQGASVPGVSTERPSFVPVGSWGYPSYTTFLSGVSSTGYTPTAVVFVTNQTLTRSWDVDYSSGHHHVPQEPHLPNTPEHQVPLPPTWALLLPLTLFLWKKHEKSSR